MIGLIELLGKRFIDDKTWAYGLLYQNFKNSVGHFRNFIFGIIIFVKISCSN